MLHRFALLTSALAIAAAIALAAPRAAQAADNCTPSRAMIILDKSSSMLDAIAGQTKWSIATSALEHVTSTFSHSIDLGLMVFPNPNKCGPGAVNVDCGSDQGDEILNALGSPPPSTGNWTPMAETLDAAAQVGSLQDSTRTRYVVLITDGWQWCSPYDSATRFAPVDAVARLSAQGVKVFVVGFGADVDAATLNQMAIMGGTEQAGCDPTGDTPGSPSPCYFQADGLDDLDDALDTIGVQVSAEICDGVDNNCDGQVDEDLTQACTTACGEGSETCDNGAWTGCDAPPVESEVCDGVDNDCDGTIDPGCACITGQTRACGDAIGACTAGTQSCGDDGTWGACDGAITATAETCNGVDDDCDGEVDNADQPLCDPGQVCKDGMCTHVTPEEPPVEPGMPSGNADGGCGCNVAGRGSSAPMVGGGLVGLAIAFMLVRRRRGR